ncbi:MAG: putative amidoligase domain-containing protein [Brevinematia bacterium]
MSKFELIAKTGNFKYEECFGNVLEIVGDYFFTGGSHIDHNLNLDNIKCPAVFCYSTIEGILDFFEKNCLIGCPFHKEYHLTKKVEDEVFFDWNDTEDILDKAGCKIYVNGKVAGVICHKLKLLHLTDWTHLEYGAKYLSEFLKEEIIPYWKLKKIKINPKKSFKLGLDIEFEELNSFEKYDPIPTKVSGGLNDKIGKDGSGDQVELRPDPSKCPQALVKKVKDLLKKVNAPLSWKGDKFPLGAHIHFGLPEKYCFPHNYQVISKLLDEVIGKFFIDLSGEARGSYKALTAYKSKPWGFEYRSLPAYVFATPELALIVLKLVKKSIKYLLENQCIEINDGKELWNKLLSHKEIKKLEFYIENQDKVHFLINQNWKLPKPKVKVFFSDDWDPKIKDYVKELIVKKEKIFQKYNVFRLHLFGFKQERGIVSNIPLTNCNIIDNFPPFNDNESMEFMSIGFPYKFRTEHSQDVLETWKVWIEDIIKFVISTKGGKECV